MKQAIFTIDVEPDFEGTEAFRLPIRYDNAMEGLELLEDSLPICYWTIFAPALAIEQNKSKFKKYVDGGANVGLLFYPEDLQERKEDEPLIHLLRAFEMEREELLNLLTSGILRCEVELCGSGVCGLRVGGYNVDVDLMEWLGEQELGIKASSSTIPSMINTDGSIDHRLYNHDPWKNGNLIEFPLTVFEGKLECWCSSSPGLGLLDNVLEIIRIADYFHYSIDAGDLVGKTLKCSNSHLAESVRDRIDVVRYMLNAHSVVQVRVADFVLPNNASNSI